MFYLFLQSGENALHIAVRYCHWEVADALLRFVSENKSHVDAVMMVNMQNVVSMHTLLGEP